MNGPILTLITSRSAPTPITRSDYLTSNLGKTRTTIATADRAAQRIRDLLCDISACLTRGDASPGPICEELRRCELDLRLLTDQVRDYVALHESETGSDEPEAA